MIVSDRIAEPFLHDDISFLHGFTWAGHPASCAAVPEGRSRSSKTEHVIENVTKNEDVLPRGLESLQDIPIVGDIRGAGYFWGIELVKDQGDQGDVGRR